MYKILVVEDDSRLNQAVCSFLNGSGYTATGALHALAAYDAIYHTKFDLIISDIMMPEVDGFEFVQTIRQSDQTTPILFMTAKDDIREFNILFKLLSYPKKAFSRAQLMEEFWDADSDATLRAVDMYIAKLREKFADRPEFKLVTVYGMGYKAVIQ